MVANPQQTYSDSGTYSKQRIEDLKQQINNLQNAVATLDDSNYIKKPEDEEAILKLEQQITNLKGVVSDLNHENGNYRRVRRSVGDDEEADRFMEQNANFLNDFMLKKETQLQLLDLEKQLGRIFL